MQQDQDPDKNKGFVKLVSYFSLQALAFRGRSVSLLARYPRCGVSLGSLIPQEFRALHSNQRRVKQH